MKKIVASLSLLIGFALTGLSANDVSRGLEAYQNNDFKSASIFFKKSSDGGDADGCKNYAILNKKGY